MFILSQKKFKNKTVPKLRKLIMIILDHIHDSQSPSLAANGLDQNDEVQQKDHFMDEFEIFDQVTRPEQTEEEVVQQQ